MDAQNAGVAHDLVSDMFDQLGIGRLAQKRAHRILDELKTAPADIGANGKADPCVKIDMRHLTETIAHASTAPVARTSFLES